MAARIDHEVFPFRIPPDFLAGTARSNTFLSAVGVVFFSDETAFERCFPLERRMLNPGGFTRLLGLLSYLFCP